MRLNEGRLQRNAQGRESKNTSTTTQGGAINLKVSGAISGLD